MTRMTESETTQPVANDCTRTIFLNLGAGAPRLPQFGDGLREVDFDPAVINHDLLTPSTQSVQRCT